MKTIGLFALGLVLSVSVQVQSQNAKTLLDEVSKKMGAYKNMVIGFNSKFTNKEAGITDETPIQGTITIANEKYNLNYLGNNFIFNGKNLAVINPEEKEVTITEENSGNDDFIYPSKLLTFYKTGYNYKMGKLTNKDGRKLQYVILTPTRGKSEIKEVLLGIDAKTKHIYKLTQIGKNGAETTFTITKFKGNQIIPKSLFTLNKAKYEKLGYYID